jgi:hypothetical protein
MDSGERQIDGCQPRQPRVVRPDTGDARRRRCRRWRSGQCRPVGPAQPNGTALQRSLAVAGGRQKIGEVRPPGVTRTGARCRNHRQQQYAIAEPPEYYRLRGGRVGFVSVTRSDGRADLASTSVYIFRPGEPIETSGEAQTQTRLPTARRTDGHAPAAGDSRRRYRGSTPGANRPSIIGSGVRTRGRSRRRS